MFARLKARRRARREAEAEARRLYAAVVARSRAPGFYLAGVPDTFDGRFDLSMLHLFLLVRRLRREGAPGRAVAQALFDAAFDDMDRTLREMGVGDLGVPRRVKAMARAFYGRAAAYDEALDAADDAALRAALGRNLIGGGAAPESLCAWVREADAALAAAPPTAAAFPPPP